MARQLVRPSRDDGAIVAGVAAALADRFGLSTFLVRLLFVIFAITGAAELVYIILWIVIPKAGHR